MALARLLMLAIVLHMHMAMADAVLLSAAPPPDAAVGRTKSPLSTAPDVHRVGNLIVDRATGRHVALKGVAMMSGEYACVHSDRIFDGQYPWACCLT